MPTLSQIVAEQDKQPRIKWLRKLERGSVSRVERVGDVVAQHHNVTDKEPDRNEIDE
jgi:hypothetical protein